MKLLTISILATAFASQLAMAQFTDAEPQQQEITVVSQKIDTCGEKKQATVHWNFKEQLYVIKYTLNEIPYESQSCVGVKNGSPLAPESVTCTSAHGTLVYTGPNGYNDGKLILGAGETTCNK